MASPDDPRERGMPSLASRFQRWYEYERHCNALTLGMLQSVPPHARASHAFTRAVGKMAHLVAARHMWLVRVGVAADAPSGWFPPTTMDELPALLASIEARWTRYLAGLCDADLAGDLVCTGSDQQRYRWGLVNVLTQLFGHAWYHRGQIAMLVADLGGKPVDTDYIFWDRPTLVANE